MLLKFDAKVSYPHPIVDKQSSKTEIFERRMGTFRRIYGSLCEIGSDGNTVLNVPLDSP